MLQGTGLQPHCYQEDGIEPIDIRFVQTHLRHVSLASTQVYTHVDPKMNAKRVRERLNKFFLQVRIKPGPEGFEPPSLCIKSLSSGLVYGSFSIITT